MFLKFRWQNSINLLIQNTEVYHSIPSSTSDSESRRLLVFVNPNSGPGAALKIFNTRVRSFLGEANISYDLIVTEYPGHCQKVVKEATHLAKYAGLVAVSGDGLLYEVNRIVNFQNCNQIKFNCNSNCRYTMGCLLEMIGTLFVKFRSEQFLKDPEMVWPVP